MLLILAIVLGALSPTSGGVLLTAIAVTVATVPFLCLSAKGGRPRMLAVAGLSYALSCLGAAAISLLADGSVSPTCLSAGAYAVIALITAICVYSLKSRLFTESMASIALSIVMILTVSLSAVYYCKAEGITEFSSMIRQLDTVIEKQLITTFEDTFRESGIASYEIEALKELIKSTWFYTKLLLPSIVYLSSHIIIHISCGIFRRIMLGYYYGSRKLSGWLLSPSPICAILFLLFTQAVTICDLLGSFLEDKDLTSFTILIMNLVLITILPCLAFGFRWLKASIRSHKPSSVLFLIILILIALVAGYFAILILAVLGAIVKIMEYVNNMAKRRSDREQ